MIVGVCVFVCLCVWDGERSNAWICGVCCRVMIQHINSVVYVAFLFIGVPEKIFRGSWYCTPSPITLLYLPLITHRLLWSPRTHYRLICNHYLVMAKFQRDTIDDDDDDDLMEALGESSHSRAGYTAAANISSKLLGFCRLVVFSF